MMSTKAKQTPKKSIGKLKECGKTNSNNNSNKIRGSDQQEYGRDGCVLTFPLLKTVDNDRMLPRYSAILNRTEEDGVGMEDLDTLQLELEALLSAVVVRTRVLQEEIRILSNAEEKRSGDSKKGKVTLGHVHKRPLPLGKPTKKQDRPLKKCKESNNSKSRAGSETNHTPLPIKFTKVKGIPATSSRASQNHSIPDYDHNDQVRHETPKIILPKNDTPNKFWMSVEPHCCDIQNDDIKVLDELIREHDNDAEFQKIPPLGRHYSLCWAQEDLEDSHEGNASKPKLRPVITPLDPATIQAKMRPSANQIDGTLIHKRSDKNDIGNPGPLTQRLLSSLIEENSVANTQEHPEERRFRGGENTKPPRNYAIASVSSLERRVRKELEQQGIFDPNEPKDPADDEILAELKKCQADLRALTNYNLTQLKRLKKLGTEEMARQDLKKKLQLVDNEVLDIYRKITASKQKKKPITKEETDHVWKCLKEREILLRQIDKF